ncbi:MAG: hypothetical protein J7L14_00530 [Candidatus Diapherotrites archaeon]|nr:hypothetical protein [Candidatus Diapherotrites archaeon]
MEKVFSSLKQVESAKIPLSEKRREILNEYFSKGGIIRLRLNSDRAVLLYPTKATISHRQRRIKEQLAELEAKKRLWKSKLVEAESYHLINNIKKFKEIVYWKHLAKFLLDPEYRKLAKTVNLPSHLIADKRWHSMIRSFVENPDYRKKLAETIEQSIVYKKDKRIGKFADVIVEFRKDSSTKKLAEVQMQIEELRKELEILNELSSWANE